MSIPPYVPMLPSDAPRVGDHQRFPGQRRPIKRFAEMATMPWEPRYGTPTPDAGYALRLAERFQDRLQLAPTERADDALAAGAVLAMQRAGRAGRGPIPADLEVGLTTLGYLGGAPAEMAAWRSHELAGIRSDYDLQRQLGERVGHQLLELTAAEIRERLRDWSAVLGVETAPAPVPAPAPASVPAPASATGPDARPGPSSSGAHGTRVGRHFQAPRRAARASRAAAGARR